MSNAVFKIKFAKGTRTDKGGYLNYIATRENVALTQSVETNKYRASKKQMELIEELKELYPQILDSEEYKNFEQNKSMIQASNVIDHCLDFSLVEENVIDGNYLKYIGERPRVVKTSTHGLWGSKDSYSLQEEVDKLNAYEGNVFNAIISLTREDATRLGYDNIDTYKNLINKNIKEIASIFHIDFKNLQWYGAFHDEGYHPHVHLVLYSTDPSEGYVSRYGIENFKKVLTNDIFVDDNINVYKQKDKLQEELSAVSQEHIKNIISNISVDQLDSLKIMKLLNKLHDGMDSYKGKKVYAYLPKNQKAIVDDIVNELSSSKEIKDLYNLWYEQQDILISHYHETKKAERIPLVDNKNFKTIKNVVINMAKDNNLPISLNEPLPTSVYNPLPMLLSGTNNAVEVDEVSEEETIVNTYSNAMKDANEDFCMDFSEDYKKAKNLLYGNEKLKIDKDVEAAFSLMQEIADKGNVLALYDIAMMQEKGLGCEVDEALAKENYLESLEGFQAILKNSKNRKTDYLNYRIGKFYNQGKGVDKNDVVALSYLENATTNKFALYTMGSIYKFGGAGEVDLEEAFNCFKKSADMGNAYGCYEVAKAYEHGYGTTIDMDKSTAYYERAYSGFEIFLEQMDDDKIQYRLGQMTYNGIGCVANQEKGIKYLKLAVENKNENAKYMLSKIYLESDDEDKINQALKFLNEMPDNSYANVLLAKTYLNGIPNHIEQDEEQAIKYLKLAIEKDNGNENAKYSLSKLYLESNDKDKINQALKFLNEIPSNAYANVLLARTYLTGIPNQLDMNETLGLQYLEKALEQNLESAKLLYGSYCIKNKKIALLPRAIKFLQDMSDDNDPNAQYWLGRFYLFGVKGFQERDEKLGKHYLSLSAEQGNEYAEKLLTYHPRQQATAMMLLNSLARIVGSNMISHNTRHSSGDRKQKAKEKTMRELLGLKD